jgi:hypothetical protein
MSRKPQTAYPEDVTVIGIPELAAMIRRAPTTIKTDLSRKPESLPPRLRMPGHSKPLWLKSDVIAWLHQCRDDPNVRRF